MKRLLPVLLALLALSVIAPLAIRAQEPPADEKLDDLIESLKNALADREASATARKPLTFEVHIYDIRDLTNPLVDYPSEQPNLTPSGGFGFGFGDVEEFEPMPFYEGDALADMVRDNIVPDSWDELSSVDCRYENGVLIVRHTPGVHERIADLLDVLRSRAASQVTVEFRLLRISDAVLRGALRAETGCVLSKEADARLEKAIESGKALVVRTGRIACTNTQRVALRDIAQVSYMQDYDVEIAQSAAIGDPIVQTVHEGFIGDVRPTIAGDGKLVVLEVRAMAAALDRPMKTVDTPVGEIQTPRMETLRVQTMVGMPLGRSAIIGGALSDGDEGALLLVVTPVATRPGRK